MKPRIAVLASGEGTTLEAFIRSGQAGAIDSRAELVISSRQTAGVAERVSNLNEEFGISIEYLVINSDTHPLALNETAVKGCQTKAEESAILEKLKAGSYDLVALMGYMKRIGSRLINEFGWSPAKKSIFETSMVNSHPGLLPETKGLYGVNVQRYVLENKLPFAGQTLHLVSAGYDEGPMINQHKLEVEPDESAAELFERVKELEKKHLPPDIDKFAKDKIMHQRKRD